MKQFILICVLVALLVPSFCAEEDDVADAGAIAFETTQTTQAPLLKNPPQCHYDVAHNRLNRGCRVEIPIKCLKGELVATMKGEAYELCCCDFSNFVKYESEGESRKR